MKVIDALVGTVCSMGNFFVWLLAWFFAFYWTLCGDPSFLIFLIVFLGTIFCINLHNASKEKE